MEKVINETKQGVQDADSCNQPSIKQLRAFHANSIREITERVNQKGLSKEDILQVVCTDDGFFLLYYM